MVILKYLAVMPNDSLFASIYCNTLKGLVTIRMNEIFPCLAFYRQNLHTSYITQVYS